MVPNEIWFSPLSNVLSRFALPDILNQSVILNFAVKNPINLSLVSLMAVRLINQRLLEATDEVLGPMTLEELLEHVTRAGAVQQSMYYI